MEGPKTSDTASSKAEKTTIPQTGDTSNVPLWFAMLIASAGVVLSGKLNDVPSGRLFRADFGFLQMCQSL